MSTFNRYLYELLLISTWYRTRYPGTVIGEFYIRTFVAGRVASLLQGLEWLQVAGSGCQWCCNGRCCVNNGPPTDQGARNLIDHAYSNNSDGIGLHPRLCDNFMCIGSRVCQRKWAELCAKPPNSWRNIKARFFCIGSKTHVRTRLLSSAAMCIHDSHHGIKAETKLAGKPCYKA